MTYRLNVFGQPTTIKATRTREGVAVETSRDGGAVSYTVLRLDEWEAMRDSLDMTLV